MINDLRQIAGIDAEVSMSATLSGLVGVDRYAMPSAVVTTAL